MQDNEHLKLVDKMAGVKDRKRAIEKEVSELTETLWQKMPIVGRHSGEDEVHMSDQDVEAAQALLERLKVLHVEYRSIGGF